VDQSRVFGGRPLHRRRTGEPGPAHACWRAPACSAGSRRGRRSHPMQNVDVRRLRTPSRLGV